MMAVDLGSLNENQRRAVAWSGGPLLVQAGPGSGKTRVLAFRVARLLEESEDAAVLALTFTNKAAAEMRERVEGLLGQRTERVRLCTFHSFAADVLRQHGSHLGLRPDFTLLTQDEDRLAILEAILEEAADELPDDGDPPPADRKNLLHFVDRLFAESYDGGERACTPAWAPLLYEKYCAALVAGNRLDFGSLLHFARRLLREKPGVARVLRLGWTHVCVDEFQDTNKAQYDLLRLIAPAKRDNLFVVGDDDQIIYQWNGASPQRLQDLRNDYEIETAQLPECYRCPAPVVALANRLIVHNARRAGGKKPIAARRKAKLDNCVVRHQVFASPEEEAAFVARDIAERNLKPADCVVLGRAAKLLERVAEALENAGYEAYLTQRKNDFETPIARVFFGALRLANARHDRDILRRLCLAWEGLAGQSLEAAAVAAAAALNGGDFLRAWADAAAVAVPGQAAAMLQRIRSDLVDSLAFPGIVEWFLGDGWKSWGEDGDPEFAEEVEIWQLLHDKLAGEYGRGGLTLNMYLQQMDLAAKTLSPGADAVRCITVHGSKGLEFKHVYLIGMAQEVFPSFQAVRKGERSKEMEEERRNCFVAITRVEETLTVTRSRRYYGYHKEPSRFLAEMGIAVDR